MSLSGGRGLDGAKCEITWGDDWFEGGLQRRLECTGHAITARISLLLPQLGWKRVSVPVSLTISVNYRGACYLGSGLCECDRLLHLPLNIGRTCLAIDLGRTKVSGTQGLHLWSTVATSKTSTLTLRCCKTSEQDWSSIRRHHW
jgi:hypothetical protein